MQKKIKLLTISDHPLSPSGVGHMTRIICESLLKSGKFQIISLGGAIRHENYQPIKIEEFGEDWIIFPVDHYGTQEFIRSMIRAHKPNVLFFMTDPRFYGHLWSIENEIRPLVPMIYYHVWDNLPFPAFNRPFYDSNDKIVTISKLTDDIVRHVSPTVDTEYLPHAVNTDIYKPLPPSQLEHIRRNYLMVNNEQGIPKDKTFFFFNSRNARRKQSGTLIWWFNDFLKIVGRNKAALIMHTDPKDPNGQDLEAIIRELGLVNGEVLFSRDKIPPEALAQIYNVVDCTVNISDAEGFGLSIMESLACGTPGIATMTGGLQEQITDGKEFFGVGIKPASQAIIGSQEVPWIYEDRIDRESFLDAMLKIHKMSREERKALGLKGREHILKNYNYENFCKRWVDIMLDLHEKHGSWENRKNYIPWSFKEVVL